METTSSTSVKSGMVRAFLPHQMYQVKSVLKPAFTTTVHRVIILLYISLGVAAFVGSFIGFAVKEEIVRSTVVDPSELVSKGFDCITSTKVSITSKAFKENILENVHVPTCSSEQNLGLSFTYQTKLMNFQSTEECLKQFSTSNLSDCSSWNDIAVKDTSTGETLYSYNESLLVVHEEELRTPFCSLVGNLSFWDYCSSNTSLQFVIDAVCANFDSGMLPPYYCVKSQRSSLFASFNSAINILSFATWCAVTGLTLAVLLFKSCTISENRQYFVKFFLPERFFNFKQNTNLRFSERLALIAWTTALSVGAIVGAVSFLRYARSRIDLNEFVSEWPTDAGLNGKECFLLRTIQENDVRQFLFDVTPKSDDYHVLQSSDLGINSSNCDADDIYDINCISSVFRFPTDSFDIPFVGNYFKNHSDCLNKLNQGHLVKCVPGNSVGAQFACFLQYRDGESREFYEVIPVAFASNVSNTTDVPLNAFNASIYNEQLTRFNLAERIAEYLCTPFEESSDLGPFQCMTSKPAYSLWQLIALSSALASSSCLITRVLLTVMIRLFTVPLHPKQQSVPIIERITNDITPMSLLVPGDNTKTVAPQRIAVFVTLLIFAGAISIWVCSFLYSRINLVTEASVYVPLEYSIGNKTWNCAFAGETRQDAFSKSFDDAVQVHFKYNHRFNSSKQCKKEIPKLYCNASHFLLENDSDKSSQNYLLRLDSRVELSIQLSNASSYEFPEFLSMICIDEIVNFVCPQFDEGPWVCKNKVGSNFITDVIEPIGTATGLADLVIGVLIYAFALLFEWIFKRQSGPDQDKTDGVTIVPSPAKRRESLPDADAGQNLEPDSIPLAAPIAGSEKTYSSSVVLDEQEKQVIPDESAATD